MPEALQIQDTTYAGEAATYMATRAVVGADTIKKKAIFVQDGIKKQKTIPRIEVANFMQPRKATPVSQGTVTVDGRVLIPQDSMLYYEFNPRDYEEHWFAEELSPTLLTRQLPRTAEAFMVMQTMKRLNEFFENAIWRSRMAYNPENQTETPAGVGDTTDAAAYFYFDGLIKKALADANTVQVPSPVALTPTNIRTAFTNAINLVPKALLYKYGAGGLKFHVSYADKNNYEEALRTDQFKNITSTESAPNLYRGYDVVPLAGLPPNTFFLCISKPDLESNLWLGINSTEDNKFELMKVQNNSELFFVKGLFKTDTQIGFTDQLVIYTTMTN